MGMGSDKGQNRMNNNNSSAISGLGGMMLFIAFLVLKLTGVIGWSWWWVTAPLWGPVALVVLGFVIGLCIYFVTHRRKR